MNLDDFEDDIDPSIILLRGRAYYRDGSVLTLKTESPNHYSAVVAGSQLYQVTLTLDADREINEIGCTCPYDWGDYCKHEVAVLYALRHLLDNPLQETEEGNEMVWEAESIDLNSLLEEVSKEALLTFLVEYAQKSPSLVSALVSAFPCSDENVYLANLGIEFRNACANGVEFIDYGREYEWEDEADEEDYIWHFTSTFKEKINDLLEMARAAIMVGRIRYAGSIASMMVHALSFFDYDTKHISDDIQASVTHIVSLFDEVVPSLEDARWLFAQFFSGAKNYDITPQATLLRLCIRFADSLIDQEMLNNYLVNLAAEETEGIWGYNCTIQSSVELRHSLLLKQQRVDEAQAFALENRHYDSLRKLAFDHAMTTKEFALAENLALERERTGRHIYGTPDWDELLFQVYQKSGETEKMRSLSRRLLLQDNLSYYPILKASYEEREWEAIVDPLLDELQAHSTANGGYRKSTYPEVLKAENKTERLLAYVQKTPTLVTVYQEELLPTYQKEVFALYKKVILSEGETVTNRNGYRGLALRCEALVLIGGAHVAKECLSALEPRYRKRPAMKDELRQAGVL